MLRRESGGLITYHFESLDAEGVVHAIFTRVGGVSGEPFDTLNVSHNVDDDGVHVAENHARVYAHLGLSAAQVTSPRQVHGNRVAVITEKDAGTTIPDTDGLVTTAPHVALLLRFADCQPILLYDSNRHALGLIHAGWRGVAQGIARRAVEAMMRAFGTHPADLIAGLGPAIGPCCYTVGDKVAAAMGYVLPKWSEAMSPQDEGSWRLDLSVANAQQLAAEGVRQIETANLCTSCRHEEFYSHRAGNGRTGRFAAAAYLLPRDTPKQFITNSRSAVPERPPQEQPRTPNPSVVSSLHPPGFPPFGGPAEDTP